MLAILLLLLFPAWALAQETHGLPSSAQEQRAWFGEAMTGYAVEDCLSSTPVADTMVFTSCRGYVLNTDSPRQLEYAHESVSRAVALDGGDGDYWVIFHASPTASVGGWTRSPAVGHYLWQKTTTQPVLPSRAMWLAKYTVSGGNITERIDWRSSNPFSPNILRVTDPLWGAIPNDGVADTAAIQGALTAASRGNVIVEFPPGVYDATGTGSPTVQDIWGTQPAVALVDADNVQIRGQAATVRAGSTAVRLLGIYDSNYVKVEGFHFIGHTETISQLKHAIAIGHNSSHVEITRNYCTNFLGDCVNVGGNFSNGTETGFTSQYVSIHHNTLKERVGNGISSVSGGTKSRLALAIEDARYVKVHDNLIYGVVDLEPNANDQYIYHVYVDNNTFSSGPVTPQAVIGSTYHYDEPIVEPGSGTNVPGGVTLTGSSATPDIGEVWIRNNSFERGSITCTVGPYVCGIVGNSFNEGVIALSATSGGGSIAFAHVEGNRTKFLFPAQTTFIRLDGMVTFGSFVNNMASVAGGYTIDDNGVSTGSGGRNYFVNNANRSATAAGVIGFTPLGTDVAGNNWFNQNSAYEHLTSSREVFTSDVVVVPKTVTVQTDCTINAGEYICDYRTLANNNWIVTASGAVTIKQIANAPSGVWLNIIRSGSNAVTLKHSSDLLLDGNADFALNTNEDSILLRSQGSNVWVQMAPVLDE